MSFVVARMQKVKSGNLVGVGNHNQRNTDNHSNKDIDVERSHLNYDLVNRTENYKRDIEQFINDNKSSSRAVRKDAVLINYRRNNFFLFSIAINYLIDKLRGA